MGKFNKRHIWYNRKTQEVFGTDLTRVMAESGEPEHVLCIACGTGFDVLYNIIEDLDGEGLCATDEGYESATEELTELQVCLCEATTPEDWFLDVEEYLKSNFRDETVGWLVEVTETAWEMRDEFFDDGEDA